MFIKGNLGLAIVALAAILLGGCSSESNEGSGDLSSRAVRIVATTGMVADAVSRVGGERVEVNALMGPGVDPHLYKASEGDVMRMAEADAIFYNGLHLEGKLTEVFEQMKRRDIRTVAVAGSIDPSRLLSPPEFEGAKDPHIWFDVSLWMMAVEAIRNALAELDPIHKGTYEANTSAYLGELATLHRYVQDETNRIPEAQRVLITAHDAFNYFGRAYGLEVRGLQGISTATEAGTGDVQELVAFIAERKIPAMFVESSVPRRSIEAVQAAVRARGFEVQIGGELFSDAMGSPESAEGTYTGMVRHNIDTIRAALCGRSE